MVLILTVWKAASVIVKHAEVTRSAVTVIHTPLSWKWNVKKPYSVDYMKRRYCEVFSYTEVYALMS